MGKKFKNYDHKIMRQGRYKELHALLLGMTQQQRNARLIRAFPQDRRFLNLRPHKIAILCKNRNFETNNPDKDYVERFYRAHYGQLNDEVRGVST